MATLLDQIMFLFTVPVLKIAIQVGIGLIALFVIIQVIRWSMQSNSPNPFTLDDRKPRRPYIVDQRKRDEILKQSFSPDKVPDQLDAIIIGSGIGGMATGIFFKRYNNDNYNLSSCSRSRPDRKNLSLGIPKLFFHLDPCDCDQYPSDRLSFY